VTLRRRVLVTKSLAQFFRACFGSPLSLAPAGPLSLAARLGCWRLRSMRADGEEYAVTLAVPAQGADKYAWSFARSGQECRCPTGIPESEAVIIIFRCQAKRIEIISSVPAAEAQEGQPVRTTLRNGAVTAAYDGKFGYTSSEEGFYFEASVAAERRCGHPEVGDIAHDQHPGQRSACRCAVSRVLWPNSRPPASANADGSLSSIFEQDTPGFRVGAKSRRNEREWVAGNESRTVWKHWLPSPLPLAC